MNISLKNFSFIIPMILKLLPLLFLILLIALLFLMFKAKVKIKFRTFLSPGFRPVRGNFGLYVYNGKQGSGKTYSLVEYLIDNRDSITVFNNISNVSHVDYFYFTGFNELLKLKDFIDYNYKDYTDLYNYAINLGFDENRATHLLDLYVDYLENNKQLVFTYDEIFTELIKGSKLSKPVIDFLCQMRKRGIIFLTTCQEWAELPLSFRRFCRFEIDCKMIPFLWTGFLVKTFKDAENMKWSNEDQEHIAPLIENTVTKTRKSIANSYDTFLRISSVAAPGVNAPGKQERDDVEIV